MIKYVYIHIPFCSNICSYCDFSKLLANNTWIDSYLNELEKEIISNYKGEVIETLYIGGGTPSSLNLEQLNKLFNIIKRINLSKNLEFTFECNIESITLDKLEHLYNNGVNRISIGVQTFNEKLLKYLNRHHTKKDVIKKINLMKKVGFHNINIDLIYAIPGETIDDLNFDLEEFLKLGITHISTYSLIIEPNTYLYIKNEKNIDEDIDFEMYNLICKRLKDNGFNHYEISNFSKKNYESKHNLTYWNNEEYYGFGMGASGYVKGVRYDNTRSLNKYLSGKYLCSKEKLSTKEKIQNEFILGLRKIKGINKENFYSKYKKNVGDVNGIRRLLSEKKLIEDDEHIYINPKYIYTSNDILINFID